MRGTVLSIFLCASTAKRPVAPPHAQSFPGMQMPVFSPGMQMTPEAAAMARYAASPPGARITEE